MYLLCNTIYSTSYVFLHRASPPLPPLLLKYSPEGGGGGEGGRTWLWYIAMFQFPPPRNVLHLVPTYIGNTINSCMYRVHCTYVFKCCNSSDQNSSSSNFTYGKRKKITIFKKALFYLLIIKREKPRYFGWFCGFFCATHAKVPYRKRTRK